MLIGAALLLVGAVVNWACIQNRVPAQAIAAEKDPVSATPA
jgi:hypothetical protein